MNKAIEKIILQGSDSWHEHRRNSIGSSESSVLLGWNKYRTLNELFLLKTDPEYKNNSENEATLWGNAKEDYVRELINTETGHNFQPICFVNEKFPIITSSLDGYDYKTKTSIEIKCPFNNYSYYNHLKKIPPYYYSQVQHHYLTGNIEQAFFISWFDNKKVIYRIDRDERVIDELRNRIIKFWHFVENKIPLEYEYFQKFEA